MSPSFHIQIITPRGIELSSEAIHVRLPDERGFVGVLSNHAPFITSSPGGRVDIRLPGGEESFYKIGSGFFEVIKNKATFLVQSFEPIQPV